jgi:hypothetical protein
LRRDACVNSFSLTHKIQIERTHDNARVISTCRMQAHKVFAIEGQDRPIATTGGIQDGFVSQGLTGLPCVVDRHNVMPEPTQFLNNWQREVLVGEQPRHSLSRLILADLPVDLVAMRAHIRPGVRQIFSVQGGIRAEQIRLTRTESPSLLQYPDRYPRANDTRLAATDAPDGINARERVAQFARDALEELRLFSPRHARQQLIGLFHCAHPATPFINSDDSTPEAHRATPDQLRPMAAAGIVRREM